MVEILGVLAIMGLLSLAAIVGWRIAMRRLAVSEIGNLVSKSAAGVITSHYLENMASQFIPGSETEYIIGDTVPLATYISDVTPTPDDIIDVYRASGEAWGLTLDQESFLAASGTVISAHAFENGRGVLMAVRQIPTEVCRELLTSDLQYDYATVLNADTFSGPHRWYAQEDIVRQENVINKICTSVDPIDANGLENVLHMGFIFDSEGCLMDGDYCGVRRPCDPTTNGECSTNISGWCAQTQDPPACEGFECEERQYWDHRKCAYVCRNGANTRLPDCLCPGETTEQTSTKEVFMGETQRCGTCPTERPVFNWTTKTCEACPGNAVWSDDTASPRYRPSLGDYDATEGCVECNVNEDCLSADRPICRRDTHTCYGCDTATDCQNNGLDNHRCDTATKLCTPCTNGLIVNTANNACECPIGLYIDATDGQCKACPTGYTNNTVNATSCPICADGYTQTAEDTTICCPTDTPPTDTPHWNTASGQCVVCLENAHCSGDTPACNTETYLCEACPDETPYWNDTTQTCVACLDHSYCPPDKPVCQSDTYTCEPCPTETPYWDSSAQKCVECLLDEHCTGTDELCYQKTNTCEVCPSEIQISLNYQGKTVDCSNEDRDILVGNYGPYVCDYDVYVSGSASGNGGGGFNSGVKRVRYPETTYDNSAYGNWLACKRVFDGGIYFKVPAGVKLTRYVIPNAGEKCHKWCCCSVNNLKITMKPSTE